MQDVYKRQIEALISLTSITYVRDDYTFAKVNECDDLKPEIDFKNLKHPLIKIEDAVGNGITLKGQTCVITGSNLSLIHIFIMKVFQKY